MTANPRNERLAALVRETGIPYRALANRVNVLGSKRNLQLSYGRSAVCQWITRGTTPTDPEVRNVVAEVLSRKLGREIRAEAIWPEDGRPSPDSPDFATLNGMDRRTVLRLIAAAVGQFAVPIEPARLVKPAEGLAKVDAAGIAVLRAGIAHCRRLDDSFGSRAATRPALAQHQLVTALLRHSQHDRIERQLWAVAGETAQLLGWLALDLNDLDTARAHLNEGLIAARRAGDDTLSMYLLGHLGVLSSEAGRHVEALAFIEAAQGKAARVPPSKAHAWVWSVTAEAHGLAGEETPSLTALDNAQNALSKAKPENDPPWIYFFDDAELASYRGACLEQLNRPEEARTTWQGVLAKLQPGLIRDRAIYLPHLAATFVVQDELHAALAPLHEAVTIAVDTESERALRRVRHLHAQLAARWSDEPAFAEFDERLRAAEGATR